MRRRRAAGPRLHGASTAVTDAGCGLTTRANPQAAAAQAITIVVPELFADLNPYLNGFNGVGTPMFEALMARTSAEPRGVLATSWRAIEPTTWEFKLKEARFHNGDPLTAEDVVFAFELARNPQAATPAAAVFTATIESASAPDARTVQLRTRAPDPILLNRAATVFVFSKKAYEAAGPERWSRPVGSGPFALRSFAPRDRVEYVVNEAYHDTRPRLSALTIAAAPESATRLAALRTGEADIARQISLDQMDSLRPLNAQAFHAQFDVSIGFRFDTNVPEFRDRRTRLGINLAVDRDTIIRGLLKGVPEALQGQPATRNMFGFNPELRAYPYNEAQARQLIAEGGHPGGFSTKVTYLATSFDFKLAAEAIQPYLLRVGIRTDLEAVDQTTYFAGFRANRLGPFVSAGFSAVELQDPASALSAFHSDPAQGGGRFANPDFDRLFAQQATELDRNRRRQIIQQMMRILHDEAPALSLWGNYETWGVSDRVSGFELPSTGIPRYELLARVK